MGRRREVSAGGSCCDQGSDGRALPGSVPAAAARSVALFAQAAQHVPEKAYQVLHAAREQFGRSSRIPPMPTPPDTYT